jgi:hypothetical protein
MLKSLGDILALLSALALAFPAWYANRYGHRLAKMNLGELQLGEPQFQSQYAKLVADLQEQRDGWKPWKAWCFYIGTLAGLIAAAILLGTGLTEHAVTPAPHT